MILAILSLLLSTSPVQTRVGKAVTNLLQKDYDVDINIAKVDLSILGKVDFQEVFIKDHHQDTLIYIKSLKSSLYSFTKVLNNNIEFGTINLKDFTLNIKTYKGETDDALTVFVEKFDDGTVSEEPSTFRMTSDEISMNNGYVAITNENIENENPLFFKNITGSGEDFKIIGPNVSIAIRDFSLIENHNLEAKSFSTDFTYSKTSMAFLNTNLETETSTLKANISFNYDRDNFIDFNNKVDIDAEIFPSDLSLIDLQKFYHEIGTDDVIHLSSKVSGQLNNLSLTDLKIETNTNAIINGDLLLVNSFNTEKGFSLDADFTNLTSNYNQLKILLPNLLGKNLPASFEELGEFSLVGKTFINEDLLKVDATLKTAIGVAITDLELHNIDNIDNASYVGNIKIINFTLGKLLEDPLMGNVSMNAYIKGKGFNLDNLNTTVKGKISKFHYNDYDYNDITINGVVKNKHFNGEVEVNDENIKLNFNGLANFASDIYEFDFKTVVDYCRLNELNVFKRDTISNLKGDIEINVKGNSFDDLVGEINFKNALYINQKDQYFFKDFKITSHFEENVRKITINSSEIIKGEIIGNFKFKELSKFAQNSIGSIYSHYKPYSIARNQRLEFKFEIYNKIVEVFFPEVTLSANSRIEGEMDSSLKLFKLNVRSPEVNAYGNKIDSLHLLIDNKNPLFNTQLSVNKVSSKIYDVSDLHLLNKTLNDTLYFVTEFKGGVNNTEKYNLSFFHTFSPEGKSVIGIQKSDIIFKNNDWVINPDNNSKNKVEYDPATKTYEFLPFLISSRKQSIDFSGVITDSISKDLKFNFKNVKLAAITPDIDSLDLGGTINGSLIYTQEGEIVRPTVDILISNFIINNSDQGDLQMSIEGKNSVKNYDLNISLVRDDNLSFSAIGDINFEEPAPTLDLNVDFEYFKLDAFSPLGEDVFNKIRGYAFGSVHVSGLVSNPEMEGDLFLDDAGLYFPYLNVDYDFEGTSIINMKNQTFTFEDVTIKDTKYNTRAKLTGNLIHNNFKVWNLNLNLGTRNLLVLDTSEDENSVYYGSAYFGGLVNIKGATDKLVIDINGRTNKGTHFIMPINEVKTAETSQLIRFVNTKGEVEDEEIRRAFISDKLKGMSLNFNLDVTKDAIFEMVIDKTSGSYLRGSGSGNLQIELDTKDKFEMYGDFVIDNGVYDFKYGGIINKPFTVKKGGTISWNGNPLTADMDIEAIYRVSANPKTLLENISTTRKIPIDLITRFSGELFNSDIQFDIEIPNSSSTVASELAFKLSNNKTTQFIALLVTGSFYNESESSFDSNSLLYGTGADMISSAFDNLLNDQDSRFKIKPEYTIGDKTTIDDVDINDQLAIAMDYQINDQIIINGKVGVPIGADEQANVIGEVTIEFLMNEAGTLRSSVFNRQNDIQYTQEEEGYTQGVGLTYQIDFDNGKELLEKLSLKKKVATDSVNNRKGLDSITNQKLINFKNKKEQQNE